MTPRSCRASPSTEARAQWSPSFLRAAERPSRGSTEDAAPLALFDFSRIAINTTPRLGADDDVDLVPEDTGVGPAAPVHNEPVPMESGSCGQPRSMHKRTSGPFLNGLTPASYFPDLASRDYPAEAGPFDVQNRAGSSIQLYGVIPGPCNAGDFLIAQTATVTRNRINGARHELEGQTVDDHKRSGRDTNDFPFRQDFLGGGAAPPGTIISWCDVPSVTYGASTSVEFDMTLTSSVSGSGGSVSADWSISIRITDGKVTSNTIT
jgi:hypothetical protein